MIDRIKQYIDYLRIGVREFEIKINASDGTIRRAIKNNTDIQAKWIIAITENYPDLSAEWLLRGEGSMLKSAEKCAPASADERQEGANMAYFDRLQARIEALVAENALLKAELSRLSQTTDTQPQAVAV